MQLRRYEAPTVHEAFKRIKAELGDQAVILSTKTIKKKNDPKAAKECWIEVTAAIERQSNNQLQIARINSKMPPDFKAPCDFQDGLRGALKPEFCKQADMSCRSALPDSQYMSYLHSLVRAGFNAETAWYLIGEAHAEQSHGQATGSMYNSLTNRIGKHLPVAGGVALNEHRQKVIAFIGTTGVGKTTTLAKIAAQCAADRRLKVRIITMDTFRIAAVEQLRIYAGIMGLPISVATSIDELIRALSACADADLVLIDTAGRSHRDTQRVYELSRWLNAHENIESHLVVSATTSAGLGESVIKCFGCTRVDRLIITKLDESITIGHLYNTIINEGIPISYVTTGQRVPEDLQVATCQYLAGLFLKGYGNS